MVALTRGLSSATVEFALIASRRRFHCCLHWRRTVDLSNRCVRAVGSMFACIGYVRSTHGNRLDRKKGSVVCEKDSKTRKWSAYAWLALARWTRWVYMSKRVRDRRSDSVEIVHLLPTTPGITTLMSWKNLILSRSRVVTGVSYWRGIPAVHYFFFFVLLNRAFRCSREEDRPEG
jgi:hypothetical protein